MYNVILAFVKGYDSFWIFSVISVNILITLYNRLVINIITQLENSKYKFVNNFEVYAWEGTTSV